MRKRYQGEKERLFVKKNGKTTKEVSKSEIHIYIFCNVSRSRVTHAA